ncbi:Ycf66 family protein [[Limnothrix rosea] IAM M-220]|uniref:Ycf66 family protein n=1 Tax=[Limnothrix rosea] IAM M-220 TaxID=454133 RepID=UPI000966CC14|nr:Ycf66 family protein [[Limnothrix rosea] IAM M-220]OKH13416.1 hypothetical protein NIES208_15225 [[Limnothrix rosea] IAM M-220]
MLAQGLAIAVAIGSALLFLTAFLFPKLHRQDDFFWSAVGLFYALILWVCAGQIVGAVLLGQLASVVLLGWFAWETLRLRQAIIDPAKIPNLDQVSLVGYVKGKFKRSPAPPTAKKTVATTPKPEEKAAETNKSSETKETEAPQAEEPKTPEPAPVTPETIAEKDSDATPEATSAESEGTTEAKEAVVAPTETPTLEESQNKAIAATEPAADLTEAETVKAAVTPSANPEKKGFSLGRIFGRKEKVEPATTNPQDLNEIFSETSEATEILAETEPEAIASAPEILTDIASEKPSTDVPSEEITTSLEPTTEEPETEKTDATATEKKEDS